MNKPLAGRQAVCWGLWRNSEPGLAGLNRPGPLRWDGALAAGGMGQWGGGGGTVAGRVCGFVFERGWLLVLSRI